MAHKPNTKGRSSQSDTAEDELKDILGVLSDDLERLNAFIQAHGLSGLPQGALRANQPRLSGTRALPEARKRAKEEIRVYLIHESGRTNIVYRWYDPVTGRRGSTSSGTSNRKAARRGLKSFTEQLKAERPASGDSWEAFRARFEEEYLPGLRPSSLNSWNTAANRFEGIIGPKNLADVNDSAISRFRSVLRSTHSDATIDSYLRTIRVAVRWAALMFPAYKPPKFKLKKHDPGGRPLLRDEFDRMLLHVGNVVGEEHAESWRRLLLGCVHSGLRLSQIIGLSWERSAPLHVENIDGRPPAIVITAKAHKGKRNQTIPMTPPMVDLLRETPVDQRHGKVFLPTSRRGVVSNRETISARIAAIGKDAGIITGKRLKHHRKDKIDKDTGEVIWKAGDVEEVLRFASCHDLKRTFVQWLLELGLSSTEVATFAQHSSFDTTWQSYTQKDAMLLAERLNAAYARQQASTSQER